MKRSGIILLLVLSGSLAFYAFKAEDEKKWEMKQYFFVMLTKGPNRTQDSLTAAKLQAGHLENITNLYNAGKLHIAGPFGDNGNWRGILILDAKTEAEARSMVEKDPAVAAGRLTYEIHPWWGGVGSVLK